MMMRGIGLILITALGSALALAGSSGYLVRVGASAIRFQEPVQRAALPPLTVDVDAPVASQGTSPTDTPSEGGVGTVGNGMAGTEVPPTQVDQPEPVAAPVLVETNRIVSPEVLLPFFRPSAAPTNRTVLVPPAFTPARPAGLPGSSATYVSPRR